MTLQLFIKQWHVCAEKVKLAQFFTFFFPPESSDLSKTSFCKYNLLLQQKNGLHEQ